MEENPIFVEYRKNLPVKWERIRQLVEAVQKERSLASLEALRFDVHKLAGNSGTYGYMTASSLCRSLELDLIEKIKTFNPHCLTSDWLSSLNDFMQKLGEAIRVPDKKIEL